MVTGWWWWWALLPAPQCLRSRALLHRLYLCISGFCIFVFLFVFLYLCFCDLWRWHSSPPTQCLLFVHYLSVLGSAWKCLYRLLYCTVSVLVGVNHCVLVSVINHWGANTIWEHSYRTLIMCASINQSIFNFSPLVIFEICSTKNFSLFARNILLLEYAKNIVWRVDWAKFPTWDPSDIWSEWCQDEKTKRQKKTIKKKFNIAISGRAVLHSCNVFGGSPYKWL